MANFNLAELFLDTVHADIIFVVDTEEIPGHRLVLAKSCDYFDKLFFGDLMKSKSKKVHITGISAKVFKEVIRFIYKRQLEVNEWAIEDLLSLLAVAHEFQLQPLISAVMRAVERQQLDFGSWPLVNSAASVYDSEELKRKCVSFTEEKIDDFIRGKDLQKFSADLICCMLDVPKMSNFNQDHFVKSICNWKRGQHSSNIISVMQKINWNKVSPEVSAAIVEEFFSTVKNVEQCKFWTKLSSIIQEPLKANTFNDCILRLDSALLTSGVKMNFVMPENEGNCFCRLDSDGLVFWFMKHDLLAYIPVKGIEFETSTQLSIEIIYGSMVDNRNPNMDVFETTSNNGRFKYRGVFSEAKPVFSVWIDSQDFKNVDEIILRNLIIY